MMGVEGGADIKVHAIRGAYHGGPDGAVAHLMRDVIRMQSEGHITEAGPDGAHLTNLDQL
jgi:hypothetical protein